MTTTPPSPDRVDMSPRAIEQRLEIVRRLHRAMQRLATGVLTGPVGERALPDVPGRRSSARARR